MRGEVDDAIARIPRRHFDQSLLAIEAAKRGNGVVLASPYLTETEVASRALSTPFDACLALENG